MKKRTFLGLMAATPVTLLAGCGGSSDGDARVRIINVNPSYGSGVSMTVDDDSKATGIVFGAASGFANVSSGSVDLVVKATGSTTELASKSYSLSSDEDYTFVLYGWAGDDAELAYYSEDEDTPDSGESSLAVLNASVDSGDVDVYITASDEDLDSSPTFTSSLAGGSRKTPKTLDAGTYRLRVTSAGDTSDLRLDTTLTVESKKIYTLILSPGSSGVLVDAHLLQQGGSVITLLNTKARVRVVPAVSANGTVALSVGDTALMSSTKSPLVADYQLVEAGTLTVAATVNGTALSTSSLTLSAGTDVTLLVTGAGAADATVMVLLDDNRLPTSSTKFKLRVVHAVPSLSADDITLELGGTSTGTSSVAYRTASSYVNRTSGDDQSVLVETQTTEIYSDDTDDFAGQGVYTAFVWEKPTTANAGGLQVKFYADR